MNPSKVKQSLMWMCWLSILVFIVLLSIYGRPLQYLIADSIGYTATAWILGLTMLAVLCFSLYSLTRFKFRLPWFHLVWFLPLFLMLPLLLDRVEERMHFLTFGVFGAVSILLFNPRPAFMVCIIGSAGDELLQFYLPDRVGDLRDVAANCLASLGAAYFVSVIKQANTD